MRKPFCSPQNFRSFPLKRSALLKLQSAQDKNESSRENSPIAEGAGNPRRASENRGRALSDANGEGLFSLLSAACALFDESVKEEKEKIGETAFSEERKEESVFSPQAAEALFRAVLTAEYCFRSGFPEGEIFCFASLASRGFRRPSEKYCFRARARWRSCTRSFLTADFIGAAKWIITRG